MKKMIIIMGFVAAFTGSALISYAGYFNTTPVNRCDVEITRDLSLGSENDEVYILQNFLSRAGYLYATPNGYFGQATRTAVKSFQRDNYISSTGIVGASTRNALNERMCDSDVHANYDYGYSSGVTYVDPYDPFVRVVTPPVTAPAVYVTPQNSVEYTSSSYPSSNYTVTPTYSAVTPATTGNGVASTQVIYAPNIGYTYGITPTSGSITITTPVEKTRYNEGDTVTLAWSTQNMSVSQYAVLLENNQTGRSREVYVTSGTTASFALTKELLDYVCAGACDNNQMNTFRIAITTPHTDIAGNTSTFRAVVSPITIIRPFAPATITLSGSKDPVDSGEAFRLLANVPVQNAYLWNQYGNGYSLRIRAICAGSLVTNIAGYGCGQEFVMPFTASTHQQEIPVVVTNTSWFKQIATFELTVVNANGQTIGTATTNVTVNGRPFSF